MRIEIPFLPPKECNPNWRGFWARKQRAVAEFRRAAALVGYQERQRWLQGHEKAEVSITFVIRDRRGYKDTDNALASLKPAIDGCVDAGVILGDDDEHLCYRLPILWEVNKERAPLTILDFREV